MDDNEGSVAIGFLMAFFIPCFIGFIVAFFVMGQPKTKQGAIYGLVAGFVLGFGLACLSIGAQVALPMLLG